MRITGYVESRERCVESGWFAFDYLLDAPIDRDYILKLRPFGGFVFLSMLSTPFFKVENDYFIIKGLQGADHFRIAVHGEYMELVREIMDTLNEV